MWAVLTCHTQRLAAGFMLIAVTGARLPSVDGLCRKMSGKCPDYHKTLHLLSYHVCNYFKHVCMCIPYLIPQSCIISIKYAHRHVKLCFGVNMDVRAV